MLKAAVIGTGSAGMDHARQLRRQPDVRIVAGVDVSISAAASFCESFGGVAYSDVAAMVAEARPDLVVIASSNAAHADNVVAAAEAGVRNIFCEKPLAIEVADAARMVDAAEAHDIRTSMGFAGLHASHLRLLELVGSGELGDLLSVYIHAFRGYGLWGRERINARGIRGRHHAVSNPTLSGGWTIHHACHQVYLLSRLGGAVRSVHGVLCTSNDQAASEEIINATLTFEGGAVGTLLDSIGSFRGVRCGAICTRGTVLIEDDHLKRSGCAAQVRSRMEGQDEDRVELIEHNPAAPTRLGEWLDAIRRGAPSPITFREGMENLLICRAIRDSSESGQVVAMDSGTPSGKSAVRVA